MVVMKLLLKTSSEYRISKQLFPTPDTKARVSGLPLEYCRSPASDDDDDDDDDGRSINPRSSVLAQFTLNDHRLRSTVTLRSPHGATSVVPTQDCHTTRRQAVAARGDVVFANDRPGGCSPSSAQRWGRAVPPALVWGLSVVLPLSPMRSSFISISYGLLLPDCEKTENQIRKNVVDHC